MDTTDYDAMDISLNEVCFEQIFENYWYGSFLDFRLIIDKNTGYFNASKLCQSAGKRFGKWLQNQTSKTFIQCLRENLDIPNSEHLDVMYKIIGRRATTYNYNGTYVCDDLITPLACWISYEFTQKVNKIIKRFNFEHFKKNEDELRRKLSVSENKCLELSDENEELNNVIVALNNTNVALNNTNVALAVENQKYQRVEEDITPKTKSCLKRHLFAVIKKNDNHSHSHYVVRRQKANYHYAIRTLKDKYPKMEIILALNYDPNAINLFNRIKEQLKNKISFHFNHIKLMNDYTEKELLNDIEQLAREKIMI